MVANCRNCWLGSFARNMNILRPGDPARERLAFNDSTWLINIGTHKLPDSDDEFEILRVSLSDAIERVLTGEDFIKCFFKFQKRADGSTNRDIQREEFRTYTYLGISRDNMFATYQVERGTKTGRVDAHIIVKVYHADRVQFDNNRFQELLDEELLAENRKFAGVPLYTRFPDKPLKWAEPKLYVSFRLLGRTLLGNALTYIDKQQTLQESERLAVNILATGFA